MIGKISVAMLYGLLWLFIFSIPVGHGKHLFNLAWFYIVDTKPIHWITSTVGGGVEASSDAAKRTADEIVGKMDSKLTQAEKAQEQAE